MEGEVAGQLPLLPRVVVLSLTPVVFLARAPDPYAFVAKQVSALPIWIFHGDADPAIPVEESRHMFAALKAIGANVQYTQLGT
jgi:predicted peptidase